MVQIWPYIKFIWNSIKTLAQQRLDSGCTTIKRRDHNANLTRYSGTQNFKSIRKTLENILLNNIIVFWYPKVIDKVCGGFRLHHDVQGQWQGPLGKRLVTQARTTWFFSLLWGSQFCKVEFLQAAQHGFEFLCERMWDHRFGGFFWEIDSGGRSPTMPEKHLYGEAFALYALSQYALVSGDSSAQTLAVQLFHLLEKKAHDTNNGGYREFFRRDWKVIDANKAGYLNALPTSKLMNTHLHILEATAKYYQLTQDPLARERLIELIFILSNAVIHKTTGVSTDVHLADWSTACERLNCRISYGHNLENIWLLTEACRIAKIPVNPLLDLFRTIFDYSLRYGFDAKLGGFYESGLVNHFADRRRKVWWVQAEALVASLQMYSLTGECLYLECFHRTLNWITRYQTDWEYGDWHRNVTVRGTPFGKKADSWKSPYHNGRAMLMCLKLLDVVDNT